MIAAFGALGCCILAVGVLQFVLDMDQAKPEKQSEVDLAFWLALVALNSVVWGGVLLIVWWSL